MTCWLTSNAHVYRRSPISEQTQATRRILWLNPLW